MKFSVGILQVMPLSNCEFCENWCCDNQSLLKGANDIFTVFSTDFFDLDKIDTEDVRRNVLSGCKFVESWRSESCTELTCCK